jgi:hypothetical protein
MFQRCYNNKVARERNSAVSQPCLGFAAAPLLTPNGAVSHLDLNNQPGECAGGNLGFLFLALTTPTLLFARCQVV